MAKERGCGQRIPGAVYLETKLGEGGQPIQDYLIDPPVPVDMEALGITPVGVKLIEMGGVTHVFDYVGSSHYPNVADVVEEAMRLGVSRRISRNLDLSKLTSDSRLILIHERAYVGNVSAYSSVQPLVCPKPEHVVTDEGCCAGVWWEDIADGDVEKDVSDDDPRTVRRLMPSFSYVGRMRPEEVDPEYRPAMFMSVPIGQVTVIDSGDARSMLDTVKSLHSAGVPVVVEQD